MSVMIENLTYDNFSYFYFYLCIAVVSKKDDWYRDYAMLDPDWQKKMPS